MPPNLPELMILLSLFRRHAHDPGELKDNQIDFPVEAILLLLPLAILIVLFLLTNPEQISSAFQCDGVQCIAEPNS
jgi:hypothetical protein